jgi:hypothetical protein
MYTYTQKPVKDFIYHSLIFCPASHPAGIVTRFFGGMMVGCDIPRGLPLNSRFFSKLHSTLGINPVL